jgi:FkbM family methyltransferase
MNFIIDQFRSIHFRGKARLLNIVGPNSGMRVTRIFNSVFELDLEDFIQRQIYLGTFEPYETRLVKKHLRPGMTFVDVGANVGYYTALAAMQVAGSGGRVIAFEPSPYAFDKLNSMVLKNKLEQVTAVRAGLSDKAGRGRLYLGVGFKNHSPTMVAHDNAAVTEITVLSLDDEVERLGIERIDLIKIDVEGHEPKVLAGAKRLLREGRIRMILCEFNEHWLCKSGSSPSRLADTLREAGFVEADQKFAAGGLENRFFRLAGSSS